MSVCSDNKFFFSHGYTGMRGWLRMIMNKCVSENLRLIRANPRSSAAYKT